MPEIGEQLIREVEFKAGEVLFHENEKTFHFFILQEGRVEVFKEGKKQTQIPLAIVDAGSPLGEFAMIDRKPRSATARALTDVKAALISEQAYGKLLSELPEWALVVMGALVQRVRSTNEFIRRHNLVDDNMKREVESLEYEKTNPGANGDGQREGTIWDTNPLLNLGSDDDESNG